MHARYALTFERGATRQSLRDRASSIGIGLACERPDLLLVADEQTRLVIGEGFAAIGQMFDDEDRRLDGSASPVQAVGVPQRGVWGNFLLFSTHEGVSHVYRDPSGSIPAYRVGGIGGDVFVSDAALAASLGLLDDCDVDPEFAVHWLQFPYLRTALTGIRQVRELIPGMALRGSPAGWSKHLSWNPWHYASKAGAQPDFCKLVEDVRSTARRTIAAQASGSTLLLQLSGGLDSSIIGACLAQSGTRFAAVNFASRSADGDERRYARVAAEHFGAPLTEIFEDDLEYPIKPPSELRFRPASNPILTPIDEAVEKYRREIGAELLVDGGGGDNLFCYLGTASPVLDAIRARGPAYALRALDDVAKLASCGLWEVAGQVFQRALPAGWWRWNEDRRFLKRDALLRRPAPHPWLDAPPFALPGKREHVASLVHIQHFLDRRVGSGSAVLHPLMGQPLIELCLSIRSWEWVRGGIDRAVARAAFGELLPASIIERRDKGSLQGVFHRAFEKLHPEFKDLLLSGRLVSLGIADAEAIEKALEGESWRNSEVQMRISEMAALELWLQSWNAVPRLASSTVT